MIKRNGWKVVLIFLIVLGYLGYMHVSGRARYLNVNIHSSKAHPLSHEIDFNPDQVVSIFKKQGIQMTLEKNTSPKYDLNGVHPKIYELNQNKQFHVYVYIFNSLKARKQVSQHVEHSFGSPFADQTTKSKNQSPPYVYGFAHSWNVLFVIPFSTTITNAEAKKFPKLDPIIFSDMNDGQTRLYKGQSKNWSTTFTYKYYKHWYKNASGVVVTDGEGEGTFDINYDGPHLPIHNVSIGYQMPHSGATDRTSVQKVRSFSMIYSAQPFVLYDTEKPKMIFEWDNKKESFVLQPQ